MKKPIQHRMLMDTREQLGLIFVHPDIRATKRHHLNVGDYCICFYDGHIPPVIFERKSIGDLFGTLTGGYDRFKAEIMRAQAQGITLFLIIEGTYTKVLKGYTRTDFYHKDKKIHVDGLRIIRTVFSLAVRYGVIPVFCKDRREMQDYIIEYYLAIWRKREEAKEPKKKVVVVRRKLR